MKKVLLLIMLLGLTPLAASSPLEEGYRAYKAAEENSSPAIRRQNFESALQLYLDAQKKYPRHEALLYNIANCYYHLQEYPSAILYYYRALKLNPRNFKAANNLKISQKQAGLNPPNHKIASVVLFFHYYLSLSECLGILLISAISFFLWQSISLWRDKKIFKTLRNTSFILIVIFSTSALTSLYFAPLQGIILKPTTLHQEASNDYTPLNYKPLLGGEKITIVSNNSEGLWFQVFTHDGQKGFISATDFEVI
ncbi:MAG: tetratricopeptide repeat protein [Chlamydiota bacterium]